MRPGMLIVVVMMGCEGAPASDAGPPPEPDAGPPPASTEPQLPSSTGACPDLGSPGRVTVSPEGLPPRDVQLWVSDAAATLDGPLVFYWHGAGSRPEEAQYGLGQDLVDAILADGGLVVAPYHDPAAGDFPWYLTTGSGTDDLVVADEILACAVETVGVDPHRVHSIGMSAGALHTSQMAFRRSSYLASVVTYSGGLFLPRTPPTDDPNNRFSALLFHGGPSDQVVIQFDEASVELWERMSARGQTAILCDHGRGHTIPVDAQPDVRAFFEAHPFGAVPSPYAEALPDGFYEACALAP